MAQQTKPRRIQIQDAHRNIRRAEVTGPEFHGPGWFQGFDDYHNPRLKKIRAMYKLDRVVQGEKSEWKRILKLRHWIKSRWHVDNSQRLGGDAFRVLELAKKGHGFHCSHCMTVQNAIYTSFGLVVRNLGSDRDWDDYGKSVHHGINDVWCNELAKWVLLDAKYDNHFEKDGIPLSALEAHEAVRKDAGRGVTMRTGPTRRVTPMNRDDRPEASVRNYWWVSYHTQPQTFTHPHYSSGSALVIPDNEYFRTTTWYRGTIDSGKPRKHWAYSAKAFIPVKDRNQIDWTPNVPDLSVSQRTESELVVRLRSATPNFKTYRISANQEDWKSVPGTSCRFHLTGKTNTLDVCARNLFNVDGPVVSLTVTTR